MNNLVRVPKGGSLVGKDSKTNFPSWSNLLDDFFSGDLHSAFNSNFNTGITLPKVNIKESIDSYNVEMAVPGLKKSDFNIDLDNQILSISTNIKEEKEEKGENYTRREFGYSSFKRSFTLPESVDTDKIKANYEDGILHIIMPKKEEAKQKPSRSIKIS